MSCAPANLIVPIIIIPCFFLLFFPLHIAVIIIFFLFFRLRRCAQLGLCFYDPFYNCHRAMFPPFIIILHSATFHFNPAFICFSSDSQGPFYNNVSDTPLPRRQSKYFSFVLSRFGISMVSRKSLYNSNLISKRFPVFLALSPPPVLSPVSVAGNFLPPFSPSPLPPFACLTLSLSYSLSFCLFSFPLYPCLQVLLSLEAEDYVKK